MLFFALYNVSNLQRSTFIHNSTNSLECCPLSKKTQAKYSGVGQHHGQRQWLRVGRGWGFAVDAANHGGLPVTRVKAVLLSRRKRANSRKAALV